MRLTTIEHQGQEYLAVLDGEGVIVPALSATETPALASMQALIEAGDSGLRELGEFVRRCPRSCRLERAAVSLCAPLPRPRNNVICLGWNYSEHIAEAGAKAPDLPEHPIVFTKASSCVTGPGGAIAFNPGYSEQMDWEVELGVIIGTSGKNIRKAEARRHIFGYTVINDVSARDVQFRHQQFYIGKSMDGGCPMGPCIVTADAIADPQNLNLQCRVNGDLMQDSNTRHMIFDIATTIEILSRGTTLQAGDVIATGTPSGVGFARQPPVFLKPGDVVECRIEHIGKLRNPVAA